MAKIKPTVGRVVWYYKYDGQAHKGPLAAHVCYVHSDSMVNLMVIDEDGNPRSETSVELIQDDSPVAPNYSYCDGIRFIYISDLLGRPYRRQPSLPIRRTGAGAYQDHCASAAWRKLSIADILLTNEPQ